MVLVSENPCEFRIKRAYTSKNTGKVSYFYTFESDDLGSFELWCSDNMILDKGKAYNLRIDMQVFNGEIRYGLKGVQSDLD